MMWKRDLGKGCVKGLLISLNVVCILMALCAFGFAIVDAKVLMQYGEDATNGTYTGDLVIIGACMLLIMTAALGCLGAARDNVKTLYCYVCALLILVAMEFLIGIFVSVKRYGLEFRVVDWLRGDFFKNVTGQELEDHHHLWDSLQSTYECCGLNGPEDYLALREAISLSCCDRAYRAPTEFAQKQLYKSCIVTASYYSSGCEDEILFTLRQGADCLLGIGVISFWFEAAGIMLAMWMANRIKSDVQAYKGMEKY